MTHRRLLSLLFATLATAGAGSVMAQPASVEDQHMVRGPVPGCDDPGGPCAAPFAVQLAPPRPPWQRRVSLSLGAGAVAAGVILSPKLSPAPYLAAELRLRWAREGKRSGIGLRVAGMASLGMRQQSFDPYGGQSTAGDAAVYGGEVGFVFDVYGFWLSPGVGVTGYLVGGHKLIVPEGNFALGYDLPLGQTLALRLSASLSTLLVSARGQIGAGLVFAF